MNQKQNVVYEIKKGMTISVFERRYGGYYYVVHNIHGNRRAFTFIGGWDKLVSKHYAWMRDMGFQQAYGEVAEQEFLKKIGVKV